MCKFLDYKEVHKRTFRIVMQHDIFPPDNEHAPCNNNNQTHDMYLNKRRYTETYIIHSIIGLQKSQQKSMVATVQT